MGRPEEIERTFGCGTQATRILPQATSPDASRERELTSAVIFIAEGSEDGVEADMREELAHVVDVFQNPELFANGLPLLGSPENDAAEQRGEVIETTIEAEATAEEHRRRELHAKLMEEPHISGGRDSEGYCGAENGGC